MRYKKKFMGMALALAMALGMAGCLPALEETSEPEQETASTASREPQSVADQRRVTFPVGGDPASPASGPEEEWPDEEWPDEEKYEEEFPMGGGLAINVELVSLIGYNNDELRLVNGEYCEPELIYGGIPYLDYSSVNCEYPFYFILETPEGVDPGELWREEYDRTGEYPTTNFWPHTFQIVSVSVPAGGLDILFPGAEGDIDYDDLCDALLQYPAIDFTPAGTNDSDSWVIEDRYTALFTCQIADSGLEYGISCSFYESGGRYILKSAGVTLKSSGLYDWLTEW